MTDLQLLGLAAVLAVTAGTVAWRWVNRLDDRDRGRVRVHTYCVPCARWIGDEDDLALHRRLLHMDRVRGPEDRGDWA